MDLSKVIFRSFKAKGLSLTSEASRTLSRVLSKEPNCTESLNCILDEIQSRIEKREITNSIIDLISIESVIADLTNSDEDLTLESTQLLDAFSQPKITFDEHQKVYKLEPKPSYSLHGSIESRAKMYRERLTFTQQRLLRSGSFVQQTIGGHITSTSDVHELCTITSLLGSTGSKILMGMITQPEEGNWYLEDLTSIIKLDLSKCRRYHLLVTEGSQVVVRGILGDGVFHVNLLEFPPMEERRSSLSAMGIEDVFGNATRPQMRQRMEELELESIHSTFVFISDVHLDNPIVVENLEKIFKGFESDDILSLPTFVLMGSFITKPVRAAGGRELTVNAFSALADAITTCPNIAEHAKFLLVPGPLDVGVSPALPRRPIPELFTGDLRKRVKKVTFASNPCRLRYYTQEIVLFREDLLKKMQRNVVLPLLTDDSTPDISEVLGRTILQQGHLCPLPLHVKPVFWGLDHSLRLVAPPHLVSPTK